MAGAAAPGMVSIQALRDELAQSLLPVDFGLQNLLDDAVNASRKMTLLALNGLRHGADHFLDLVLGLLCVLHGRVEVLVKALFAPLAVLLLALPSVIALIDVAVKLVPVLALVAVLATLAILLLLAISRRATTLGIAVIFPFATFAVPIAITISLALAILLLLLLLEVGVDVLGVLACHLGVGEATILQDLQTLVLEHVVDFHVGRHIPKLHVAGTPTGEVHEDVVPHLVGENELALTRRQSAIELAVKVDFRAVSRSSPKAAVVGGDNAKTEKHLPDERVLFKQLPSRQLKTLGDGILHFSNLLLVVSHNPPILLVELLGIYLRGTCFLTQTTPILYHLSV